MINRASVPMWGIAGQPAGPPKWAGKKKDRGRDRGWDIGRDRGRDRRSCGTDPILSTQRFPRGRDPILSTQRLLCGRDPSSSTQRCPRGRDRIFSTQRFSWGNQWYIQNISALRAPICQEFPKNLFWKSWKLKDKFSNREWIIYEGDAAGRCTSCTSNLGAQVTKVAQVAPLCR